MLSNLTPARQKLLIKVSVLLNLSLILYLSLSAGSRLSSSSPLTHPPPLAAAYSVDILHKHSDLETQTRSRDVPSESCSSDQPPSLQFSVSENVTCLNRRLEFSQGSRGKFWVLYNYIRAEREFNCNESITYTTHGDFTFLDNLEPLLERWQGPISVAVYSPGSDLDETIDSILFFRDCSKTNLVRDFATFHIFFDLDHIPATVPRQETLLDQRENCQPPSFMTDEVTTYKKRLALDYPVNIARNVARVTAATHFIFPSDIELYPSPSLITDFLAMIRRNDAQLQRKSPRVFVNSIFEIAANHSLPSNKSQLVELLKSNIVIPFHKTVCPQCHKIPKALEWPQAEIKPGMNVFHVGKRMKPFQHWEPIYIGTNQEPWYDERLTWEGRSDKMAQGFKLCLLNYEFHILDNAFLIHRPGIKTKKTLQTSLKKKKISAQNEYLKKTIFPEIKKLYGARKGCEMF